MVWSVCLPGGLPFLWEEHEGAIEVADGEIALLFALLLAAGLPQVEHMVGCWYLGVTSSGPEE